MVCFSSPGFAYFYTVDFTDPVFDESTWHGVFDGSWYDTGSTFYGIADNVSWVAAAYYEDLPNLSTTDIFLSTRFTANSNTGLFIGAAPRSGTSPDPEGFFMPDEYDVITVGLTRGVPGNSEAIVLFIDNNNANNMDEPDDWNELSGADENMVFQLDVQIAGTDLYWDVFNIDGINDDTPDWEGSFSGAQELTGLAGIFTEDGGADFGSFTVNAVPAPAAFLLLASGLLGLTGFKRRQP